MADVVYTVERRSNSYAVYNSQGRKVESFRTRSEAQEKADELNKELETNNK